MDLGLHIIQYPTGSYGFVGRVPQCLAHDGDAELLEVARQSGPGFAARIAKREGKIFRTLTWPTETAAKEYAASKGYTV